jgi:transposase
LHEKCYEKAKELFNLNTALIQTARDKAVEILKSSEEKRKEDSVLKLERISIRFDKRCYSFSKTDDALTPYWLTLSLNRKERISLPIVFGGKQRQRIEEALKGEWKFATVEMVKRDGEWYAHFILKKEVRNTSKSCHRCGHVAQVNGREFRCPKCGLIYNRDLNACINIAHALTRGMRWGSCGPPEPADEVGGEKPQLNAGSSRL